jgi:bacterioferritin (cytochrome b1)
LIVNRNEKLERAVKTEREYGNDPIDVTDAVQQNIQEESRAIINYNTLLKSALASDMPDDVKREFKREIAEIVADELNHIDRLKDIYTYITGIVTAKE